jgi:4'-phosphopantetheinyl transferase
VDWNCALTLGGRAEGDAIEVAVAGLAAEPETVRASAGLLSDAERQKAARFTFERDARRFIVARARLRQHLATRLGERPESIDLVYGPQGKPALGRRFADSGLQFNVSHRDEVAVYAFSSGGAIGIDVEAVHALPEANNIAARFFSHRENAAYRALEPHDQAQGFFNCWTRKEAFIKAQGDGLSHRLDRFDVSLTPGEPAEILRVDDTPGSRCGWRLESFSPAAGFVAAVVVQGRRP